MRNKKPWETSASKDRPNRGWTLSLSLLLLAAGLAAALYTAPVASPQSQTEGFAQCPRTPLDIALVIDRSGSMTGSPLAAAKDGAKALVDGLDPTLDQSGLVSYSGSATLDKSLSVDHAATKTAIDALSAGGITATGDAIDRSHQDVKNNGRTGVRHIMIVLTDGFTNAGSDPITEAIQAKTDGTISPPIEIFAIGLGTSVNVPELQAIASDPDVDYFFNPQTTDELLAVFEEILARVLPQVDAHASATAVEAELSVPANPHLEVVPVQHSGTSGQTSEVLVHRTLASPIDGYVTTARGEATTAMAPGLSEARGNETIAEVSLLGGLVYARALHAVAESRTVSGSTVLDGSESSFAEVRVAGATVPVPVAPNTVIPLPGVGFVVLNEQRTHAQGDQASELLVNMVHVVVDNAQMRGDIVVGQAYAGTTCDPVLGTLFETPDNDAGTGGDAGNAPSGATPVSSPALFQGRTSDGDSADHYRVWAWPGEKVEATLLPSHRAASEVGPQPSMPSNSMALAGYRLELFEPSTFALRESSGLPGAFPHHVELNVDKAGPWVIGVENAGAGPSNYTLAIVVRPIAMLPDEGAPDVCGAGPVLASGAHVGMLDQNDPTDFYRVSAAAGDRLAITLKPGEDLDGVDHDLRLYSPSCTLIDQSSLGKGAIPKGTPDAVVRNPVMASGTYHVEVVRANGIGSYTLDVVVADT